MNPIARAQVDARLGGDGYAIDAALSGGMGDVWLLSRHESPKDPRFAARVAVKTFHADVPEKMVVNELTNWLGLRHPLITRLLAIDYVNWRLAAVMPRMEGSLYEVIVKKPFEPTVASRIVRNVLFALEFAFGELGIYHLDIKPQNILWINSPANIKVADWGISRLVSARAVTTWLSDVSITFTSVSGTPGYMGPERFDPDWPVTAAADLYSLGLVASELVAGAFVSDLIRKHGFNERGVAAVNGAATHVASQMGGSLGNFITQCTALEPHLRPASFTEALRMFSIS
ncbi:MULTISPECIES: serine/threonine-protein kinase [Rhodanobacter]|uniref:serine/threonine-protein kinase n=1 Tax=Rhodanobacter TaxID=75309 RepID=UPI0009DBE5B2|nr:MULTISPECIES: serine/threonine-protein kinase [Rhodanobacter]TAN17142.1 MAG: serine/threonine protein kinase [Rhodanobacter sp.]UJJ53730.1 serine/threonine protein kinase [Rhodanobacter thiooxydans]